MRADFNASPIVIRHKDQDLVAATGNDGTAVSARRHVARRRRPQDAAPRHAEVHGRRRWGALATWDDDGTRWILAPVAGAVAAGVEVRRGGSASRARQHRRVQARGRRRDQAGARAWQSRDLVSPLGAGRRQRHGVRRLERRVPCAGAPGAATLTASQRAQQSVPAVLYVLDGASGKQLWTSGKTITSFARAGLAAGGGQVYS